MGMDAPTITLNDEAGRSLLCYIERTIEVEGEEYLLLMPADSPVEIFAWDEDADEEESEPTLVSEDDEIDAIFPTAKAVLGELNLTLKRSAVTLTVEGELPDTDEEDDLVDEDGEEEGYEELQLLATFYHEEQEYAIYAPLDPYLILTRLDENGEPQLLSDEELKKLEPILPAIEDELFYEELD